MKRKNVVLIILAAVMLVAVFGLAACGSKSNLEGKYNLSSMTVNGKAVDPAQFEKLGFSSTFLEFSADGVLSGQIGPSAIPQVKFTREGDDIKIDTSSVGYTFAVTGDDITLEYQNSKLVFSKE